MSANISLVWAGIVQHQPTTYEPASWGTSHWILVLVINSSGFWLQLLIQLSVTIHFATFPNPPADSFPGLINQKSTGQGWNSTFPGLYSQAAGKSWSCPGSVASAKPQTVLGHKALLCTKGTHTVWWRRKQVLWLGCRKPVTSLKAPQGRGESTATRIGSRKYRSR